MELSAFTLKLIILLVPGALGAILLERLTLHKKEWSSFKFVVNSVLIGLFAYALDEMGVRLWNLLLNCYLPHVSIFKGLANAQDNVIPWGEVLIASLTGVAIGIVLVNGDNAKWLNRAARYFKVSHKYGDENLFSYYLRGRSRQPESLEKVQLRDISKGNINEGKPLTPRNQVPPPPPPRPSQNAATR